MNGKGKDEDIFVNGVRFFYDPNEITLTDAVMKKLEEFSFHAEENAYSFYYDDGELIIF